LSSCRINYYGDVKYSWLLIINRVNWALHKSSESRADVTDCDKSFAATSFLGVHS
jgi:hypothetical protein